MRKVRETPVGFKVHPDIVEAIDYLVKDQRVASRGELIRDALKRRLLELETLPAELKSRVEAAYTNSRYAARRPRK